MSSTDEGRELLSLVMENIFCGLILMDMQKNIILFNCSAAKIFMIARENTIGKNIKDIKELKGINDLILLHAERDKSRYKLKAENSIIVNLTTLKRCGSPKYIMAICHESCSYDCIDQELFVTKYLLEEIEIFLQSSYDGFMVMDNQGKVIKVNAAWERMYSISKEKVLGTKMSTLLEKGLLKDSAALAVLKTGKRQTVSCEAITGQSTMATGTPVLDDDGNIKSVVVNVRDLSELKHLERRLAKQELMEKYFHGIKETDWLKEGFPEIIMYSKEMKKVMDIVFRVAEVDSNVLITGESGVGKGLVATTIHKMGCRREGAFISINCGALPAPLLESELFGYEPGAFTGASSHGKKGLFELANGGTLFLDEIGDAPIDIQVKLLRAIQEKEVIRLGGTKSQKIDVHIIAATNRDLEKMIAEKRFRSDLYYRLNVIDITVPPLRKRKDDIIPLIKYYVDCFNKKHKKNKTLTCETIKLLLEYNWPGNIRELENLIERLVILSEDNVIQPDMLPEVFHRTCVSNQKIVVNGVIPMKSAMKSVEQQLLLNAKELYGSTRKMADALGIDQSTVVRKMNAIESGQSI